jgi:succinyl-diaminopimelate desuccinylase
MSAASHSVIDPVELTRDLIRIPSVTPADEGAMDVLERTLTGLGFTCRRMVFEGPTGVGHDTRIENLYARRGTASPNLCFAGHTDVVPTGDLKAWTAAPFEGETRDGILYGRGAVDMKGGIAAWVAAVSRVLAEGDTPGSLSFLITGDEEGPALHGTKRVVEALAAEGEVIDACVVGEPSSAHHLGDMIKVGRRGSLNTWITVHGKQGHVAYPDRAANPAPVVAKLLARLDAHILDEGYPSLDANAPLAERDCVSVGFPPSNLEITTIDVGNPATNIIPAEAKARLNIRFNPTHTGDGLIDWLNPACASS